MAMKKRTRRTFRRATSVGLSLIKNLLGLLITFIQCEFFMQTGNHFAHTGCGMLDSDAACSMHTPCLETARTHRPPNGKPL
jgi:hypothetical protein